MLQILLSWIRIRNSKAAGSALRRTTGSGSKKNECGSTALPYIIYSFKKPYIILYRIFWHTDQYVWYGSQVLISWIIDYLLQIYMLRIVYLVSKVSHTKYSASLWSEINLFLFSSLIFFISFHFEATRGRLTLLESLLDFRVLQLGQPGGQCSG